MRKRVKKILIIVLIAGLSTVAIIAGCMFLYRVWYNSDGQVEKRHQAALTAQKEAFAQYKREAHKQILEREQKDFGRCAEIFPCSKGSDPLFYEAGRVHYSAAHYSSEILRHRRRDALQQEESLPPGRWRTFKKRLSFT